MGAKTDKDFKELRTKCDSLLVDTLFRLMDEKGVSYSDLSGQIETNYGAKLNPGNISKYKDQKIKIPFIIVFEVCKLLNIPVDELLRLAWGDTHEDVEHVDQSSGKTDDLSADAHHTLTITLPSDDSLVSESSNKVFRGYDGEYHIYFTPTSSSDKGYLKGCMTVVPHGTSVYLKLELKQHCCGGEVYDVDKTYEGSLVASTSVHCCYCILSCSDVGELCFLAFRHMTLNKKNLECRVAEALTVSAGAEDRCPTVHRVLISREPIKDEDVVQLLPLLKLNSSTIIISDEELNAISGRSPKNRAAIEQILLATGAERKTYYQIREDTVRTTVRDMKTVGKKHALPLIVEMRERAESSRYNKVSQKADDCIRDFLKLHGYFRNP